MNLTETVGGPLPLGARQRPTSLNQLTPLQPDRDAVALTAARATAPAAAPPRIGVCG
jgi:hypothetical protein